MTDAIERIIVPLDAASENRTTIDTAVRLAAQVKAPLLGVFVEDEELLHLASLPFARQVTLGGRTEGLTIENIELQLKAAAERARSELFAEAERHRVKCSFEIVRGASERAIAVASERDLVVAGALTRPVGGHFRLEQRWWSSMEIVPGPLLLARNPWSTPGPVAMLLRDRSAASERLFKAAAQVAAAKKSDLTVICPLAIAGADGFEKWLADQTKEQPIRIQVEIAAVELTDLRDRVGELDCRVLAFDARLAEGRGDRLQKIAGRFACDILVVR